MRYMETFGESTSGMGSGAATASPVAGMSKLTLHPNDSTAAGIPSVGGEYVTISTSDLSSSAGSSSAPSSTSDKKARLLYCKSHVSIHPTNFSKDNISGYLGVVEVDTPVTSTVDDEGNVSGGQTEGKELLVTWVPEEVVQRMDERDREGYKRVESWSNQDKGEKEEDGFVFVSIPPPKGEKYAFSVPISQLYSILVYSPSLSHWYGSATFNLSGGVSLPTLYFHDDESPLLASQPTIGETPKPRSQWGFPPFLTLLESRASMLRSRLITPRQNQGAELWLVNPSKADREVHEAGYEEIPRVQATTKAPVPTQDNIGSQRRSSIPVSAGLFGGAFVPNYPPVAQFPSSPMSTASPKQTLMMGLSNITNFTRKAAKEVLNHPLAQPVIPHLPPTVRSMVNVHGEGVGPGRRGSGAGLPGGKGKGSDVASEFESARLYLARWARVVAEEGERARKQELARQATLDGREVEESLAGSLGVFSLLSHGSKKPVPSPTRRPDEPITARDWDSFAAQGRDELYIRREIFRRGFSLSDDVEEKRARREGWEVLLDIIKWDVGVLGGGEEGRRARIADRQALRARKRREYTELKAKWQKEAKESRGEGWREEWHRIDVDCRRTDRNQAIFAVPKEAKIRGEEEKEGGGSGSSGNWDGKGEEEEGGMAALNPHIAALRSILMTYHTYSPELGYVQGMSDLLAPIYVVFEANEADAFWGLVGVMEMMESNFLRDQSGMKRQLSILQRLIGVMDPELYAHLEKTDSLNLFFCFRWILISFKREFAFSQVIRLWEVLWTSYYSDQFNLFVALAILQSHRDVLMRYLQEFDEVLKYANDLSGSIDLDTTLAQAEVLFLTFRTLVTDFDNDLHRTAQSRPEEIGGIGIRKRRGSGVSIKSDTGAEVVKGGDVAELRGLVKGWGESVRAEEDLEVVLSLSRRGSEVDLRRQRSRPQEVYMPLM